MHAYDVNRVRSIVFAVGCLFGRLIKRSDCCRIAFHIGESCFVHKFFRFVAAVFHPYRPRLFDLFSQSLRSLGLLPSEGSASQLRSVCPGPTGPLSAVAAGTPRVQRCPREVRVGPLRQVWSARSSCELGDAMRASRLVRVAMWLLALAAVVGRARAQDCEELRPALEQASRRPCNLLEFSMSQGVRRVS